MMENNSRLMAVSVISAIILWVFVVATENPTIERDFRNIPIVYKNLDSLYNKDMDLVGDRETTVDIVLSGASNNFISLRPSDLRAEVDMKDFDENSDTIPISFFYPSNLTLVESSKDQVDVRVEKIISKEVKIEINQTGTPADNFAVLVGSVIPESIAVEGARSAVDRAEKAIAVQDMAEITSNTTKNTPIRIIDSNGEEVSGLNLSQNFINVSYDVYKIAQVPIKLVVGNDLDESLAVGSSKLSQDMVSIMVPSSSKVVPEYIETRPFDLSKVTESGSYKLDLIIPEGFRLRDTENEISIVYDLSPSTSKSIVKNSRDVEVRGAQGLSPSVEENIVINVEILGTKEQLDSLGPANIKLFVDASNLNSGDHYLPIKVEDLEAGRINQVSPSRIRVRLVD